MNQKERISPKGEISDEEPKKENAATGERVDEEPKVENIDSEEVDPEQ